MGGRNLAGAVEAADHNLGAAADLPGPDRNRDVVAGAAVDHSLDAVADPAGHQSQDGKDGGTRGISFPWDHNIP